MVTTQLSVFTIATGRGAAVLQQLVGEWYSGTITSDRAKAYDSQPLRRRQLCWAHLLRDFQAMIDRGGPGQAVGEALLEHAHVLFAWWHWVRDGTWKRSTFQSYVRTLRASFKMELEWGRQSACPKTAATCRELLAREAALWTFVRVEGIEPTNNAAERSLRGAVLWRKVSFGTQSEQWQSLCRLHADRADELSATTTQCLGLSHCLLSGVLCESPDSFAPPVNSE